MIHRALRFFLYLDILLASLAASAVVPTAYGPALLPDVVQRVRLQTRAWRTKRICTNIAAGAAKMDAK